MVYKREDIMDVFGTIHTEDYVLTLEESEGNLFCHIKLRNWSTAVYKRMLVDLGQIRECVGVPLFCNIQRAEDFKIKLATMFGFMIIAQTDTTYLMELL
tara:strand:- start:443 stop:739 length:297 start_codon:yes stop_codon:yes gene_type:complete